jgi:uncharacterized protein with HEPN domain
VWRNQRDAVLDMRQACSEALAFAAVYRADDPNLEKMRLRAIERCLAVLGEAAKRVPGELRGRYPHIPWRAMAGLRDVLVHDYFGVDPAVLAQVLTEELPKLSRELDDLCAAEGWFGDDA